MLDQITRIKPKNKSKAWFISTETARKIKLTKILEFNCADEKRNG